MHYVPPWIYRNRYAPRNMAYPPSRHMQFRMGLTVGDVVEREGDLLGDGVNIAARLQGLATPGGICVSRSVHEQVANKLSVLFNDLGPQEVKNIPAPVYAYRVDLGRDQEKPSPSITPPFRSAGVQIADPAGERSMRTRRLLFIVAIILIGVAGIWFINKTWLFQQIASSTKPATEAVQFQKPRTKSPRDIASPLRTRLGTPFNAAEAPFTCDKCREDLGRGITGKPGHSAIALSLDGFTHWSFGKMTTAEARKIALTQCVDAKRLDCFVYADRWRDYLGRAVAAAADKALV